MAGTTGENKNRLFVLTLIGVAVLVAAIVVNVIIRNDNRDKQAQAAALDNQIAQVQQQIQSVVAPPSDLDARLAAVQSELANAQRALPSTINRNDVIDYVLATANQTGVDVIPLFVSAGADKSYHTLQINSTVSGRLGDIMDFVTLLQGGQIPALVVTGCTVNKVEGVDYTKQELGTRVTLSLSFTIYAALPVAGGGVS